MTITYMERIASLPQELQEIAMENWDITGRPQNNVANPSSNAIIAILDKNAVAGGKAFMEDMKLMFPDMPSYESATYYNVYIAGMNKLKDMLLKDK